MLHGLEGHADALIGLEGSDVGFELLHDADGVRTAVLDAGGVGCCAHVGHVSCDGAESLCGLGIEDYGWFGIGFGAVEGFGQFGGVGGESGDHAQVRGESEDGEGGSRGDFAHELEHLAADIDLAGEWSVEAVEQEDVDGRGGRVLRGVGEGVWGKDWRLDGWSGSRCGSGAVFVEGDDGLFMAIFEDVKVVLIEAVDGFAAIGNSYVDQDKAGVGVEDGGCWIGGLRGLSEGDGCREQCGRDQNGDGAGRMHSGALSELSLCMLAQFWGFVAENAAESWFVEEICVVCGGGYAMAS